MSELLCLKDGINRSIIHQEHVLRLNLQETETMDREGAVYSAAIINTEITLLMCSGREARAAD